jgi:uncharacterized protein YlxP (DUF503 family)
MSPTDKLEIMQNIKPVLDKARQKFVISAEEHKELNEHMESCLSCATGNDQSCAACEEKFADAINRVIEKCADDLRSAGYDVPAGSPSPVVA